MKNVFEKCKAYYITAKEWALLRYTENTSGKRTPNIKAISYTVTPCLLGFGILYAFFGSPDDTSRLAKTTESVRDTISKSQEPDKVAEAIKGIANEAAAKGSKSEGGSSGEGRRPSINFRAKQVIERSDYTDPSNMLPTGTDFVGRLTRSIDTRAIGNFVTIELPYGGSFENNLILPKVSHLFASVKYDGNGDKVFLDIQSGTYPSGQDFKLRAMALSARDFSPGVEGDFHGTFSNRVAANLGLAFVTGLSDTLQEKESVGGGGAFAPGAVTPKPTIKNGLLAGVSKVSDLESQRMAKELASKQPYVTVDAGKELIVSLLERFVKGK